jgi:hypothetical protein
MNIPLALESAFNTTLRTFGNLGGDVSIRTWQRLENDGTVDEDGSRTFPQVDIRSAAPATDENQVTCFCDLLLTCMTLVEADRRRTDIQTVYSGVQTVIDSMYAQFRSTGMTPVEGTELYVFVAAVAEEISSQQTSPPTVSIGGFSFPETTAPYEDEGRNTIEMVMRIHYARSDW